MAQLLIQLSFLGSDLVQLLKLIALITLPIAFVVLIGFWVYIKRARRNRTD